MAKKLGKFSKVQALLLCVNSEKVMAIRDTLTKKPGTTISQIAKLNDFKIMRCSQLISECEEVRLVTREIIGTSSHIYWNESMYESYCGTLAAFENVIH